MNYATTNVAINRLSNITEQTNKTNNTNNTNNTVTTNKTDSESEQQIEYYDEEGRRVTAFYC